MLLCLNSSTRHRWEVRFRPQLWWHKSSIYANVRRNTSNSSEIIRQNTKRHKHIRLNGSLSLSHSLTLMQDGDLTRGTEPPASTQHPLQRYRKSCLPSRRIIMNNYINLYAPCILYIGQTYRYSTDRHHASYIYNRCAVTPQTGTMHPIYRTDVPLLHRQAPCILCIGQTYRYSTDMHHASYI